MKKALRLLLMYFWFLPVCLVAGTIFYSLYLNSLHMVAGQATLFLNIHRFVMAFFMVTEVSVMVIGACMTAYKIRHPTQAGWQCCSYSFMQLIMWTVLLPFSFRMEQRYYNNHISDFTQVEENEILTKGYFRQQGNQIYYFMDDLKSSYAEGEKGATTIRIDTDSTGKIRIQDVYNSSNLEIVKAASPYKDILLKNTFVREGAFEFSFFNHLIEIARENLNLGWTFFLGFLSIGFALSAVFGISGLSDWKLMNFTIIIIATIPILAVNNFYYTDLFAGFRELDFMNNKLFLWLGKYTTSPFLIFSNIIFGLLMILTGSTVAIIRAARKRGI